MPQKIKPKRKIHPAQTQNLPGSESRMNPRPKYQAINPSRGLKLEDRVALITGGDSGIGRAVAMAFADQGADVAISYLNEHEDARETKRLIESYGRRCLLLPGDIGSEKHCIRIVEKAVKKFGRLDIVVNNAAVQFPQKSILDITEKQLDRTFRTNIYAMFFISKAALRHLQPGSAIINTTSVTAYRGSTVLLDYSSTKGAIVTFTRSLSHSLVEKGIRVNAVAPGPIWTPLIPATFPNEKVKTFGSDVPMGRAGQPNEVASCYVFLASSDSTYFTGQVMHPNGGEIVNG